MHASACPVRDLLIHLNYIHVFAGLQWARIIIGSGPPCMSAAAV